MATYGPDITKWDRRRRYEQRHRDQGLCQKCSEPQVEGSVYCERHRAIERIVTKARPLNRIAAGMCVKCGRPLGPEDAGMTHHNRNECIPSRRIRL